MFMEMRDDGRWGASMTLLEIPWVPLWDLCCLQLWCPKHKKDMELAEKVQRGPQS